MNKAICIVLLASTWVTAAASSAPGEASEPDRIWILTDESALTTAVIGIAVGQSEDVLFIARSKSPKLFRGLALLEDELPVVVESGGLTFHPKLIVMHGDTGEVVRSNPLESFGYNDLGAFPDGTIGATKLGASFSFVLRIAPSGQTRISWPLAFALDDLHVDALGRNWVTSRQLEQTWCLDSLGSPLNVLDLSGKQLATAPDGTLWYAGMGAWDLVHATTEGEVLAVVDVPGLPESSALCVDVEGKIWVSGHAADRIECFGPDGAHRRTVMLPGPVGVQHMVVR